MNEDDLLDQMGQLDKKADEVTQNAMDVAERLGEQAHDLRLATSAMREAVEQGYIDPRGSYPAIERLIGSLHGTLGRLETYISEADRLSVDFMMSGTIYTNTAVTLITLYGGDEVGQVEPIVELTQAADARLNRPGIKERLDLINSTLGRRHDQL